MVLVLLVLMVKMVVDLVVVLVEIKESKTCLKISCEVVGGGGKVKKKIG